MVGLLLKTAVGVGGFIALRHAFNLIEDLRQSLLELRFDKQDEAERVETKIQGMYERYHALLLASASGKTVQLPTNSSATTEEVYSVLESWRKDRADRDDVNPCSIVNDNSLLELAIHRPTTNADLLAISGIGKVRVKRYGEEIIAILKEFAI